jgi:hypothetical protein
MTPKDTSKYSMEEKPMDILTILVKKNILVTVIDIRDNRTILKWLLDMEFVSAKI